HQEFRKETYLQTNLLLEAYRQKDMHREFKNYSRSILKELDREFSKGISYFHNMTHLYFQKLSYTGMDDFAEVESDINNLFENLKMSFITTTVECMSVILNLKEDFVNGSMAKVWNLNEILGYIKKNKTKIKKNYVTVYIFYLTLICKIENQKLMHFYELKKMVLKNLNQFTDNILRHILLNMLNYSIEKLNKGNEKFLKEIFFINRILDERSLTLYGEYIHHNYFYSVVESSVFCNEISWAETFVDKYQGYLPEEYKESAVNLSFSRINFANKRFNDSLKNLLTVKNLNPYYYLSHKVLLLQNYFEKKEFDSAFHVIDSMKKYFRRRLTNSGNFGISLPSGKDYYSIFVDYFRNLLSLKLRKSYNANKLLAEITAQKFFIGKDWLLSKIKGLK
ncbi:MAG: hypothetical protein ACRDFC_05960, partial [Ignavibacteria bacterium]